MLLPGLPSRKAFHGFAEKPRRLYNSSMAKTMIVKCPICGRKNDVNADPIGPFCSTRCKRVDLGKWLGEEYRISEPLRPDHLAGYEEMEGQALDDPDQEP
jgi:hypothetical protein